MTVNITAEHLKYVGVALFAVYFVYSSIRNHLFRMDTKIELRALREWTKWTRDEFTKSGGSYSDSVGRLATVENKLGDLDSKVTTLEVQAYKLTADRKEQPTKLPMKLPTVDEWNSIGDTVYYPHRTATIINGDHRRVSMLGPDPSHKLLERFEQFGMDVNHIVLNSSREHWNKVVGRDWNTVGKVVGSFVVSPSAHQNTITQLIRVENENGVAYAMVDAEGLKFDGGTESNDVGDIKYGFASGCWWG